MLSSRDLRWGHWAPPGPEKAPLVLPVCATCARARSSVGVVRQRICGHEKQEVCWVPGWPSRNSQCRSPDP